MIHPRKFWIAVSAVALVGVTGGAAVVARYEAPRAADGYVGAEPSPGDVPETAAVGAPVTAAEVTGRLGILERRRTRADRVPAAIARSPLFADRPAVLAAARRVRGADGPAWIAPGSNGETICYFAPGELTCPPAEAIARDGAALGAAWHADTPVRVTGVVSDGVDALTIVAHDGGRHVVRVVDNYVEFEAAEMPREARWTGPRGPEVYRFPDVGG